MRAVIAVMVMAGQAWAAPVPAPVTHGAVDPAELDARTHEVALTLRCVVCKNQSIAESDAGLAKDLERRVRERIAAGDSNDEARAYIVERYGEFVLLKPRFSWRNAGLWALPAVVLGLAAFGAVLFIRAKARIPAAQVTELTAEERAELQARMGSDTRA